MEPKRAIDRILPTCRVSRGRPPRSGGARTARGSLRRPSQRAAGDRKPFRRTNRASASRQRKPRELEPSYLGAETEPLHAMPRTGPLSGQSAAEGDTVRRSWVLTACIVALAWPACNGKTGNSAGSSSSTGGAATGGGAGAAGSFGGGGALGGGGAFGGGSTLGVGGWVFAPGPDAGTVCDFSYLECRGVPSFVDIQDGGTVHLAFPSDAGCGTCAENTCQLWSFAVAACGTMDVILSACAGPDGSPPCLDTASSIAGSYVDPNGKTWTWASLRGSDPQFGGGDAAAGLLDLDLTLTISDGTTSRALPVHSFTCGDIRRTGLPCPPH